MAVPVAIRSEEVDSRKPVDLQVDEPGNCDSLSVRGREAEPGDSSTENLDVAGNEGSVDESGFDPEPHSAFSRARPMLLPEASSRSRAVWASTPARSETMATRVSPCASARALSTCSPDAPVAASTMCRTRS